MSETESSNSTAQPDTDSGDDPSTALPVADREPRTYLLWAALVVSLLLALISAFSLYFQIGAIIGIWIDRRYQPIFRAAFNLAVLLLAGYSALSLADILGMRD